MPFATTTLLLCIFFTIINLFLLAERENICIRMVKSAPVIQLRATKCTNK